MSHDILAINTQAVTKADGTICRDFDSQALHHIRQSTAAPLGNGTSGDELQPSLDVFFHTPSVYRVVRISP
ncbi:hypothetical protein Hypma_005168 [Hypsizygus marmoreus]|uniref:Uncharacterized protein n=1 Tax=Hypsizygus marmoreus TaxID=39966 RepID=A0A369K5J8_HYPMA|nr:hypothetical protein Hypma_005168 [Hypsizygus marmoreus]